MRTYDVAAYIWPSYHYEPRLEHFWPEKDGEWYIIRRQTPRFPGHAIPRVPLLGYQDEADPKVMRQHVELALEHGVNVFIMDWYWYENAPCLERQINEGLLPAIEGTDCKFYLMWANHDVDNLWNMNENTYWGNGPKAPKLWSAQVTREGLEPMFDRIIEKYLGHPNYYRLDDKPVFSIFAYPNLVAGLGGAEATADAFAWMRQRCEEEGLGGLDIQAIARLSAGVEAGASLKKGSEAEVVRTLAFDSSTSYNFDAKKSGDYMVWADKSIQAWEQHEKAYGTYYPIVSCGWDNTFRNPGFAEESVVVNATPDAFEAALHRAKMYLDARPDQTPLVTINSWNEWTEGSYLLPDMRWGYRYLQAVRNVFGGKLDQR